MEVHAKRRGGGGGSSRHANPTMPAGRRARNRPPHEKHSRALSRILRHSAAEQGIPIDAAGFVDVAVLLARPQFRGLALAGLQAIVTSCPKQRFGIEQRDDGRWYIRANQGHTMDSVAAEELLTPVTSADVARYPVVVHGTNGPAWAAIRTAGLNRMSRQHVHFATGLPGEDGVVSGMRKGSQVLVYLDLARALAAGIPFFVSANGVLLSPGQGATNAIPPVFFAGAVDSRTGEALLPVPAALPGAAASAASAASAAPPGPQSGGGDGDGDDPASWIEAELARVAGDQTLTKAQRKNSKRRLNKQLARLKLHPDAPFAAPHHANAATRPSPSLAPAASASPACTIRVIEGDLLAAPEQYIVHQTNCVSKAAQGLALSIFQRHPHADVYARRAAPCREQHTPGTIDVCGGGDGDCKPRRGVQQRRHHL